MSKFELIWATNRRLSDDFYSDVRRVVRGEKIDKILLRESDLNASEYQKMAIKVLEILGENNSHAKLIVHTHANVARELGVRELHLPFAKFKQICASGINLANFSVGVSVHSLDEALQAQNLGASYVVAGHIFDTPSHEGERGRGLGFLEQICANLRVKTYAIGGINFSNLDEIKRAGATGAYMMRGFLWE